MRNLTAAEADLAPEQPKLLSDAHERLGRVFKSLIDANERIDAVTVRVFGPHPVGGNTANGGTNGNPVSAATALVELIRDVALQAERLHEAVSRVERIG